MRVSSERVDLFPGDGCKVGPREHGEVAVLLAESEQELDSCL